MKLFFSSPGFCPPGEAVLHCRRRKYVWTNVSLPLSDTRWRARRHKCRPIFLWGNKPRGLQEELHPLASAASSTPPQLTLGDKTPRNDKEIPLGDETPGTKEDLHPLASAATSTPPQLPLEEKTPRNNPLVSADTLSAPASLGGQKTRDNSWKNSMNKQQNEK